MQRDPNRYDCQLSGTLSLQGPADPAAPAWEALARDGPWLPLVRRLLERDGQTMRVYRCGCVVSLPGAGEQYWHSDGAHQGPGAGWPPAEAADRCGWAEAAAAPPHNLCVFVPLVDLTHTNGYTEFWAGSQHYDGLLAKKGAQALPGGTAGILPAGSALLYDFRTIHRGMPNASAKRRPILYFVYAHEGWAETRNFATAVGSVFDGAPLEAG